jgi:hypothetical protein
MESNTLTHNAELYNSKIKLLNWLYEETKLQPEELREIISEKGQELPLNL